MSIQQLTQYAHSIKPIGLWIMTLIIDNGGRLEIQNYDLAKLCGVSNETLLTARRRLIRNGLIKYTADCDKLPKVYEVVG